MLRFTPQLRILIAREPADFRKGIDALVAFCRRELEQDPFSGCLFVSRNRAATPLRVLSYDFDRRPAWAHRLDERRPHDRGRAKPERHVDEKDPRPREMVGDEPAGERPGDAREAPDAAEHALDLRPLLGRVDVRDDRHADRHERPGPEPLDRAEDDELGIEVACPHKTDPARNTRTESW